MYALRYIRIESSASPPPEAAGPISLLRFFVIVLGFAFIRTRWVGFALPAQSADFTNERRSAMPKQPRPEKAAKSSLNKPVIALANLDNPESAELTPLNFRVPKAFHREFKMYAVQHGISMVDLLQESFRVLKEARGR